MGRFTTTAVSFGILVLLILVWTPAHAVTFTVTSNADSGPGTLREAIDMANANTNGPGVIDVIEFDLTLPDTIALTSGELVISDDLTINGPGADMLTVSGSNLSRIFSIVEGDKATISSLRIADGNGVGAGSSGTAGGAILMSANNVEVELNDCALENNSTTGFSADGAITSITPEIKLVVNRCSFTNNSAISTSFDFARGGVFGMTTDRFTLEVNDSSFKSNYAQSDDGIAAGGVIALSREQLDIKFNNCTFDSNYVISNNEDADPSYGGAIGDFDTSGSGVVEITNSTFFGNYIECNAEECEVYGGAIGSDGNTNISCDHCTFLSNTVSCTGDDCVATGETIGVLDSGKITISNSIMSADNTSNNCSVPVTSLGYNIDNGMSCVDGTETGDKANTDPMLDPLGLQDNGGLTETIALLPASMAVDMADPLSIVMEDQRKALRPFGIQNDIGAFEFGAVAPGGFFHNSITPAIASNINSIMAEEATAGGKVAFVWGTAPGSVILGGSVCNGLEIEIRRPKLLGFMNADADGIAELIFFIPQIGDFEIPWLTQAIDVKTCATSEVIQEIITKQ